MAIPLRHVIVTERGWGGHFVMAARCMWRRNSLIEYGERRIVVSSVGRCLDRASTPAEEKIMAIGSNGRMMETMCFVARFDKPYWEADIHRQLTTGGKLEWSCKDADYMATLRYEEIHTTHVKWWQGQIASLSGAEWHKLTRETD